MLLYGVTRTYIKMVSIQFQNRSQQKSYCRKIINIDWICCSYIWDPRALVLLFMAPDDYPIIHPKLVRFFSLEKNENKPTIRCKIAVDH